MKKVDGWAVVFQEPIDETLEINGGFLGSFIIGDDEDAINAYCERENDGRYAVPVRIIIGEESIAEFEKMKEDAEELRLLKAQYPLYKLEDGKVTKVEDKPCPTHSLN